MHTMRELMMLIEARTASLYHATRAATAVQILHDNAIKGRPQDIEGRTVESVSLTRDPRYAARFRRNSEVIFELDQERLAQRYRLIPRDEFGAMRAQNPEMFAGYKRRVPKEAEEVAIGSITPLDHYLVAIHLTPHFDPAAGDFSIILNHPKLNQQ